MSQRDRQPRGGAALTAVILATFRANGRLLAAGDVIAAHDGLTSARWQVLGAVAMAGQPLTVPQIARRIGLARQSVHATVGVLVTDGLLERTRNVDHRRSALVATTARGEEVFRSLQERQAAWADELASGLSSEDLSVTARVLDALCARLDAAAVPHT